MGHLQHIQQAPGNSNLAPSGNVIGSVGRVNHNTSHTARNAQFNSDSNTHSPINNTMHQRMMPVNNGNGVTLQPPHTGQMPDQWAMRDLPTHGLQGIVCRTPSVA